MKAYLATPLLAVLLQAQTPSTMAPPVRASHHMVAAANNFEVEAGYRILTEGGNAVDAGVASVLAASVTELSRFGLGGEMPLLIKMSGQPTIAISGVGVAPAKATVEFYTHRTPEVWEERNSMPPVPVQGILSAITPGVFDGLILALEKYGTKSFTQVVQPALEYASEGFPMPEEFGGMLRSYQQHHCTVARFGKVFLSRRPAHAARRDVPRTHAGPDLPRAGRTRRKKAHGNRQAKLRAVRDVFYKGDIAQRIAAFSESHRGLIAYSDLANYHAEIDEPKVGTYRGYEIYKPGLLDARSGDDRSLEPAGRLRPESHGPQQPAISAHRGGGRKAGVCRSRRLLWRP